MKLLVLSEYGEAKLEVQGYPGGQTWGAKISDRGDWSEPDILWGIWPNVHPLCIKIQGWR